MPQNVPPSIEWNMQCLRRACNLQRPSIAGCLGEAWHIIVEWRLWQVPRGSPDKRPQPERIDHGYVGPGEVDAGISLGRSLGKEAYCSLLAEIGRRASWSLACI